MFCSRFRFWPKNGLVIKTEEEAEVFILESSEFGHQSSRKNEENRICIGPYQSTDIQITQYKTITFFKHCCITVMDRAMVMPCICPGSVHAKVHLLHHKQATMAVEMKGFIVLLLFAFSIVILDC